MFGRLVKFRRADRDRYEDLSGDDGVRSAAGSRVEFHAVSGEGTPSTPGSTKTFPEGKLFQYDGATKGLLAYLSSTLPLLTRDQNWK